MKKSKLDITTQDILACKIPDKLKIEKLEAKIKEQSEELKKLRFDVHLDSVSDRVKTWPEWKQSMFGPSDAMKAALREIDRINLLLQNTSSVLELYAKESNGELARAMLEKLKKVDNYERK